MRWSKIVGGLVALGLFAGLWLSLQPEKNPATAAANQHVAYHWAYTNGQVIGPAELDVMQGQTVKITISSDSHEQLRLHGYEEWLTLPAEQTTSIELVAKHQGRFELELDQAQKTLAHMRVYPTPERRVSLLASNSFREWH